MVGGGVAVVIGVADSNSCLCPCYGCCSRSCCVRVSERLRAGVGVRLLFLVCTAATVGVVTGYIRTNAYGSVILVAAVDVKFVDVAVVFVWGAVKRIILDTHFQLNRNMLLHLCPALRVGVCGVVRLFLRLHVSLCAVLSSRFRFLSESASTTFCPRKPMGTQPVRVSNMEAVFALAHGGKRASHGTARPQEPNLAGDHEVRCSTSWNIAGSISNLA